MLRPLACCIHDPTGMCQTQLAPDPTVSSLFRFFCTHKCVFYSIDSGLRREDQRTNPFRQETHLRVCPSAIPLPSVDRLRTISKRNKLASQIAISPNLPLAESIETRGLSSNKVAGRHTARETSFTGAARAAMDVEGMRNCHNCPRSTKTARLLLSPCASHHYKALNADKCSRLL